MVGIRALKAHPSKYIGLAGDGEKVVITRHGRDTAIIQAPDVQHDGLRRLRERGMVKWSCGKPRQDPRWDTDQDHWRADLPDRPGYAGARLTVSFDTGALQQLFVDETHTEETRDWARAAGAIASSRVTLPEASSSIDRRYRGGSLSTASAWRLLRAIAAFWQAAAVIELDGVCAGGETFAFASFDLALNRAARAEGLTVLEPCD
jgi:antitoxin (DNA-binding transcriptional repressor) of toxin-antitoxin stability system